MLALRRGVLVAAMISSRGTAWSLSRGARCFRTSGSRRIDNGHTRAALDDNDDGAVSKFEIGLNGPMLTRKPGTPFIVGVAGGTASGKTAVVKRIVAALDDPSVAILPQDCYYRSLSEEEHERAEASNYNFDHPSAFSFDRVLEALLKIRAGAEITEVPCYDYVTHSVMGPEHNSKIVKPSIVILEGILAFHDPAVRALLDMKIFVDTDADTRLARRIKRDISERGRDLDGVLTQYERFVKPSFDAFCMPQRTHADVILPRGKENQVAIAMVVENLRTMLVEYECEVADAKIAMEVEAAASSQMAPQK